MAIGGEDCCNWFLRIDAGYGMLLGGRSEVLLPCSAFIARQDSVLDMRPPR
jgi:hypothetical protein